ncbi:MAG: response regulator [Chitinophagaceae bacterium]
MTTDNIVEILLAEDNPEDAELTVRALRKVNLANRLVQVENGQQVLDFLYSKGAYSGKDAAPPRLILLDLKMPKVDGIEVLRTIKSDETTRTIPVVMLTSSAEETDIVKSYELGVNSYVVKPVEFTAFFKAISELGLYWMLMNRSRQ